MRRTILIYVCRFAMFATVYCAAVFWWATNEGGHGAIGIVAGGIILAGVAILAWIAALVLGRYVASAQARLVLHVVSVVGLFAAVSVAVFVINGMTAAYELDFIEPMAGIIAIAALADGAIGLWRVSVK